MNTDKNFNALEYIHSVTWRGSVLGLSRVYELLGRMENPQKKLKFIHIAGTNGKGSTAAMISSVLQQAGYKTGLYTSPFITHFEERIQVNDKPISKDELSELTSEIKKCSMEMVDPPTEFEIITALAFAHFLKKRCDIVVLEVGLGGKLDATNVIDTPELAVITTIGLDHTKELGDTVEKIAAEKAGIIKAYGDVVLYPQEPGVYEVFDRVCKEKGAKVHPIDFSDLAAVSHGLDGQTFDYGELKGFQISLLGEHQLHNAATAIKAVLTLMDKGWSIDRKSIYEGLQRAKWPGRFELIHKNPIVIVDGGHNPQGVASLVENCKIYFPGKKIIFVVGVLADKDYMAMLQLTLPIASRFIAVTPESSRALPANELAVYLQGIHNDATAFQTIREGLKNALESASDSDVICAFGSLYMTGEIRAFFLD